MKAILLSAGFGTRLRPLTNTIPKCLVPIKGKQLLEIWLERLSLSGLGPFLINTHYKAEQVERFINQSTYKNIVTLVHEPEILGTAGTLITNMDFFCDEDGILIHADNYSEADFNEFIQTHNNRPEGCLLTMMTFRTDSPSSCGIVELDGEGIVIGFHEKVLNPPGNLANGAVYILSAELLNLIRHKYSTAIDFSTEILPDLLGLIYSYETRELFRDIGTPDSYALINSMSLKKPNSL